MALGKRSTKGDDGGAGGGSDDGGGEGAWGDVEKVRRREVGKELHSD
jgi:hypothetical protein